VIKIFSIVNHLDTLLNFETTDEYIFEKDNENYHVDLVKLRNGQVKIAVFAVFVEPNHKPEFALQRTIQLVDRFHSLIDSNEELRHIKNYSDIKKVMESEQIGAILSIEGAEGIFDLSALRTFFKLGVRMISLTWNQRNHLADGVGEYEANGGLTILGKKMINEMNKLKIIMDVSHIAPAGFWDIVKYSKSPIIASHSNANGIFKHKRNLDDQQIKAIVKSGGLIGLNFAPFFISSKEKVEINDLIRHIDYIKGLVGIENIISGTDYNGIDTTPQGLEDIGKLRNLEEQLYEHGYNENEIKKIFYKNNLKYFKNIWV